MGDDERQAQIAQQALARAETVALTLPALCELCWVLRRGCKLSSEEITRAIQLLIESAHIVVDRPGFDAGLALLDEGGDFTDGVIAHGGTMLGAETFVSFHKAAVRHLAANGRSARLLG